MQNPFIAYLNSLHNLSPSGSNALAESQALSPYFSELYERLPVSQEIVKLLCDDKDRVVVLTGHAGDGKSTIALDVLKSIRKLPLDRPLTQALCELERIDAANVNIVKDMSELGSAQRQEWLNEAFSKAGSWLIVSNTGPLLQSLRDYGDTVEEGYLDESVILDYLDADVELEALESHTIKHFSKPLTIINLTRLDNSGLGAKLLGKLVSHSGWATCDECPCATKCPINQNRNALYQARETVEERVRWMYRRIGAYEKRLTIRQMVAQLALGITGGMACPNQEEATADSEIASLSLESVLFSEIFFGHKDGAPWTDALALEAVAAAAKARFGGPVSVDYEKQIATTSGLGWASMPDALEDLENKWRVRAADASAVRWRYSLRRMIYIFGAIKEDKLQQAAPFLNGFLQSPTLRDFDLWQEDKKRTLTKHHSNRLRSSCLKFLLEIYSGFSAGQFIKNDKLYITLRRPDQSVIQPTQLVIRKLDFRDFDVDLLNGIPRLIHRPSRAQLLLTLPLLDLIQRREQGELGSDLSPIHQARLDRFRSDLLGAKYSTFDDEEIELLSAMLDGQIRTRVLLLDETSGRLELDA